MRKNCSEWKIVFKWQKFSKSYKCVNTCKTYQENVDNTKIQTTYKQKSQCRLKLGKHCKF